MAELYEPFDGGPYMNDAGWSTIWGWSMASGVVEPNPTAYTPSQQMLVYAESDGKQVKIKPGQVHICGKIYTNPDTIILPVAGNASGANRQDRVAIRADWLAKTIRCVITPGTPGGAAPTPVQIRGSVWEVPLALVDVANGFNTITANDVHMDRQWATLGTEKWQSYTAIAQASVGPSPTLVADAGNFARFKVVGNTVTVKYRWRTQITGGGAGNAYTIRLPFPAAYNNTPGAGAVQNAAGLVRTVFSNSNTFGLLEMANGQGANLNNPSGSTDERFTIEYEALIY